MTIQGLELTALITECKALLFPFEVLYLVQKVISTLVQELMTQKFTHVNQHILWQQGCLGVVLMISQVQELMI
jgi:hypothetical protein